MESNYVVDTQTQITELTKIFNQIFNFLREAISIISQALSGIKVTYGWQTATADDADTEDEG